LSFTQAGGSNLGIFVGPQIKAYRLNRGGGVLARAAQQSSTVRAVTSAEGKGGPRLTGPEVGFQSTTLRLRGKADRVRQVGPHEFEVRDFKTGVTLDERGEVKAEIALQLWAYGFMLLERRPGCAVRLIVDDGSEREVPFDADARSRARRPLDVLLESMPSAGHSSASDLAVPERGCRGWWRQYPEHVERLSSDTWGTVLDVVGDGRVYVILRDEAGRRVRVDGVDARHGVSSALVGRSTWFFGLEATGPTRSFDGGRVHPRSFHELPRDRMERRAWALHVFGESVAAP
jgi:hypothetical protein